MPVAARQYQLGINTLLDERRDPQKASQAAAKMLNDLYRLFGDWHLAIAAYNCGPENVNKAIHRSGGERDYWKIYPYLPRETRGYVPAFIAANYVMNYYCEHNICPMRTDLPAKTDTVLLQRNLHLAQVAAVMGLDMDMLRALNPQLRRDIVPGASGSAWLRLPAEETARFIDLQDSIFAYQPEKYLNRRAEVTPSEDLYANGKTSRAGKKASNRSKTVTVRKGQTLSEIARSNGVSVKQLQRLNGLRGTNIRAGQRIRVK
jgi:membrane-bound lytic murein transglycosylase D